MPDQVRLVIVDTNCYVRLYYSRLRPILGTVIAGYRLLTLQELADEAKVGTNLVERNAWLCAPDIQQDIDGAVFELSAEQRLEYLELAKQYRHLGDGMLRAYCIEKGITVRSLSLADAKALAIATDFNAVLATDEWPLRWVSTKVELDDGRTTQLFSSLDLLKLLETEGKISRSERVEIVKEWLRMGEKLLSGWRIDYGALFNEVPPTAQ
jgi:hypothetical protein